MRKQELLNYFNDELTEKLYGFCYARCRDSYEAQDLCSDILFALVKASKTDGEIEDAYAYIWRIARNVYADHSDKRRRLAETVYQGDSEEVLPFIADERTEDEGDERLDAVYHRIAFLTRAYREVMIMFYLDGLSTAQIAEYQKTSEVAVRQRLFSARKKVKSEVENMAEMSIRPVVLDKINYHIWGNGRPAWGDPRTVCTRQFSKHIVWMCRKKAMSAVEIAAELSVPTVYVEEELEILTRGENGEYGLLRRLENGKYALNFVLLDKDVMEKANEIYMEQLPEISRIVTDFIEEHKEAYLAFPYLNKQVDLNLILWQQVFTIARAFGDQVDKALAETCFANIQKTERPFTVFGYVDNGKTYNGSWNGANAENVCGFKSVHLDSVSLAHVKAHFYSGLNVAADPQIQLALRAVDGLDVGVLSELEKEHAAKAIECGYLYREGEMLYTKILVSRREDMDRLYAVSKKLSEGYFDKEARKTAEKIADLIRRNVPDYLLGEWEYANALAGLPILDAIVEMLVEKGVLIPPAGGLGAEGCWMSVER